MRDRKLQLQGAYRGHWIEFDSTVPLELFEAALDGGPEDRLEFIRACIKAWTLGPVPRESTEALEGIPWDIREFLPLLFMRAFDLTKEEDSAMECLAWVGHTSMPLPYEFTKLRLCERLNVPYAPSYGELKAGEVLRLRKALAVEAECSR